MSNQLPPGTPTVPIAAPPPPPPPAEPPPLKFTTATVGDKFEGTVIDYIFGADETYLIYESDGTLIFHEDGLRFKREVFDVFQEYTALRQSRFQGAYPTYTRNLMGSALVRACCADTLEGVRKPFDIVKQFVEEKSPVGRVFGCTSKFAVYAEKDGNIEWDYPNHPDALLPFIGEFQKLSQTAMTVLEEEQDKKAMAQLLGSELAVAFRYAGKSGTPAEVFSASREFLSKRLEAVVSNIYVLASLIAAAAFGILLAIAVTLLPARFAATVQPLAMGAAAGMIGALISVLQRSFSVIVTQFAPKSQVISQALVRMILGMTFGVFVVIAVKGNIAFGAYAQSNYALFLFAAAAGLSERFIPDFLTGLTTKK